MFNIILYNKILSRELWQFYYLTVMLLFAFTYMIDQSQPYNGIGLGKVAFSRQDISYYVALVLLYYNVIVAHLALPSFWYKRWNILGNIVIMSIKFIGIMLFWRIIEFSVIRWGLLDLEYGAAYPSLSAIQHHPDIPVFLQIFGISTDKGAILPFSFRLDFAYGYHFMVWFITMFSLYLSYRFFRQKPQQLNMALKLSALPTTLFLLALPIGILLLLDHLDFFPYLSIQTVDGMLYGVFPFYGLRDICVGIFIFFVPVGIVLRYVFKVLGGFIFKP